MLFDKRAKFIIKNTTLALSCLLSELNATSANQQADIKPGHQINLIEENTPSGFRIEKDKLSLLKDGVISWNEITPEEKKDPIFYLEGLKSKDWLKVLNSLSSVHIKNAEIQQAIILRLSTSNVSNRRKISTNEIEELSSHIKEIK